MAVNLLDPLGLNKPQKIPKKRDPPPSSSAPCTTSQDPSSIPSTSSSVPSSSEDPPPPSVPSTAEVLPPPSSSSPRKRSISPDQDEGDQDEVSPPKKLSFSSLPSPAYTSASLPTSASLAAAYSSKRMPEMPSRFLVFQTSYLYMSFFLGKKAYMVKMEESLGKHPGGHFIGPCVRGPGAKHYDCTCNLWAALGC